MTTYPLSDYGLLITKYMAAHIIRAYDKKFGTIPSSIEAMDDERFEQACHDAMTGNKTPDVELLDLQDYFNVSDAYDVLSLDKLTVASDCVIYCSKFTGTAVMILEDGTDSGRTYDYNDEFVCYLQCEKETKPFNTAYPNKTAMVDEFWNKVKNFIPNRAQVEAAVVNINGTYIC